MPTSQGKDEMQEDTGCGVPSTTPCWAQGPDPHPPHTHVPQRPSPSWLHSHLHSAPLQQEWGRGEGPFTLPALLPHCSSPCSLPDSLPRCPPRSPLSSCKSKLLLWVPARPLGAQSTSGSLPPVLPAPHRDQHGPHPISGSSYPQSSRGPAPSWGPLKSPPQPTSHLQPLPQYERGMWLG